MHEDIFNESSSFDDDSLNIDLLSQFSEEFNEDNMSSKFTPLNPQSSFTLTPLETEKINIFMNGFIQIISHLIMLVHLIVMKQKKQEKKEEDKMIKQKLNIHHLKMIVKWLKFKSVILHF